MTSQQQSGSIFSAMCWMFFISILLFWLPLLGPFLAGVIGGKKAGGIGAGLMAVFLPAVLLATFLFFMTTFLSGQVAFGFITGLGYIALSISAIGPLLIGAIVGAILSKNG